MSIEEALEHDLVASLLEDTIDNGQLIPGAKGWRHHQAELVDGYLSRPDESGTPPLARIHVAPRRAAWLELPGRDEAERDLLEHALATTNHPPSPAESEEAIEPLLWLLEQLTNGVKLTQTGALPRTLVRAAVERYPDWWNSAVAKPYQEAELYQLCVLHDLIDALKLARRQRVTLQLTRKDEHSVPTHRAYSGKSPPRSRPELPAELDLALAQAVIDDQPDQIDWSLQGLLSPFHGITIEHHTTPTATTRGGRTLAAAILNARAHGPRNTLS